MTLTVGVTAVHVFAVKADSVPRVPKVAVPSWFAPGATFVQLGSTVRVNVSPGARLLLTLTTEVHVAVADAARTDGALTIAPKMTPEMPRDTIVVLRTPMTSPSPHAKHSFGAPL